MKAKASASVLTVTLLIALMVLISSGYNNDGTDSFQQKGSVKLAYNYPVGNHVKYLQNSKIIQLMDIQGQSMQVNVNSSLGCSVKGAGPSGSGLKLEIRIDTLGQTIDSPQGFGGGAVQAVKGKVFNLGLTTAGKVSDISEAQKIVYSYDGSSQTNASQAFYDFFPKLPVAPLSPGETWSSTDTADLVTPGMSMRTITNSVSKFEGIEKIGGIECARITSDLEGTQTMSTEAQGMGVFTSGSFEGKSTLFFAIREGYFVEQNVTGKLQGMIDVSGQMTFPLEMETTSTTKMIK